MVIDYHMEMALPAKRLSVAMLTSAMSDASRGDRHAVAWLSSRQAEKWFDMVDIPQSSFLARSGWMEWAREALLEGENAVIQASLTYMEDLLG